MLSIDDPDLDAVLGRPPEGKAQRTFDQLVAAARDEIVASGSASPEAVAARAAMAPATLYTYFSAKDDLVAAAFDQVLAGLNSRIASRMTIERLLDNGLGAVVADVVTAVRRGFAADAPVFRLALARLPERRLIREVYRAREAEALATLRRFVELGAEAGKVAGDDPDVLAGVLLVSLQGLNNPHLLRDERADEVVAALSTALVAALVAD